MLACHHAIVLSSRHSQVDTMSIVHLAVVPPSEANKVHLVAVSNLGFRFYLTSDRPGGGDDLSGASPLPPPAAPL